MFFQCFSGFFVKKNQGTGAIDRLERVWQAKGSSAGGPDWCLGDVKAQHSLDTRHHTQS